MAYTRTDYEPWLDTPSNPDVHESLRARRWIQGSFTCEIANDAFLLLIFRLLLQLLLQHGGYLLSLLATLCQTIAQHTTCQVRWIRLLYRCAIDLCEVIPLAMLYLMFWHILEENEYVFHQFGYKFPYHHHAMARYYLSEQLGSILDICVQMLGAVLLAALQICIIEFAATGRAPFFTDAIPLQTPRAIIKFAFARKSCITTLIRIHSPPAQGNTTAPPRLQSISTPEKLALQTSSSPSDVGSLARCTSPAPLQTSPPTPVSKLEYNAQDPNIWEMSPTTEDLIQNNSLSPIESEHGFRDYGEEEGEDSSRFAEGLFEDDLTENMMNVGLGFDDDDDETF